MIREHFVARLTELAQAVDTMGTVVLETISASVDALEARDASRAKEIVEADSRVDGMRHEIDERAFVLIATQQPAATDLRFVMGCTMVATELERIADYCSGIAKLTLTMVGEPVGGPTDDIRAMSHVTRDLLSSALVAFRARDAAAAARIWSRDDEVDHLYEEIFKRQLDEMVMHRERIRRGTYMLWIAHNIERMADRVTNIAEDVAFVATGDVASFRENIQAQSVPV